MSAKHDEDRKHEEEEHLRRLAWEDLRAAPSPAEQASPVVAPPELANLAHQIAPSREEAHRLLRYWVEEGARSSMGAHLSRMEDDEEREGRRGGPERDLSGGAGGHLDDDRRSTMTSDFVADSAVVVGAMEGPGGPVGPLKEGGAYGGDDGDEAADADEGGKGAKGGGGGRP